MNAIEAANDLGPPPDPWGASDELEARRRQENWEKDWLATFLLTVIYDECLPELGGRELNLMLSEILRKISMDSEHNTVCGEGPRFHVQFPFTYYGILGAGIPNRYEMEVCHPIAPMFERDELHRPIPTDWPPIAV